jgi:catechol 2,3-dioxygenase-like lactoylglutathione lyase family enzyme
MKDESRRYTTLTVFHPIHWVSDLQEAGAWLERIFGRPTVSLTELMGDEPHRDGYTIDYAIFCFIQDVFFESMDPARLTLGGRESIPSRRMPPPSVPRLTHFGWYVEGAEELFAALTEAGLHCQSQLGEPITEPSRAGKTDFVSYYAMPEEVGLAYQLHENPAGKPRAYLFGDPRLEPGWTVPPVSAEDPLGVERCSHHTVLTTQPDRALRLVVDLLGGKIIHEGENELLQTRSTFVALGDGVFEYAVPSSNSASMASALADAPDDLYYSLAWKVQDLERAQAHLLRQGVRTMMSDDQTIITDPATSLGVPWTFTATLTPGDPRGE